MDNSVILCISDTHFPYQHIDLIKFLTALKMRFKPTRVIHLGDEMDNSALSFHERDPDSLSANEEFNKSVALMKGMCELFGKIDFIESNHGSLAYRRAKFGGIPARYIRTYQEVLGLDPENYIWHKELEVELPTGSKCLFVHENGANALTAAKDRCTCLVQGHYHSSMSINYFGTETNQKWAMQLPCLIDNSKSAFDYNKKVSKRPKVGAGIIFYGHPMLVPMSMNNGFRFTQIFGGDV